MDNVVDLDVPTRLDIPADRVIDAAKKAGLAHVVIVGVTGDGNEYFAMSVSDAADILWMLERAKLKLLRVGDG